MRTTIALVASATIVLAGCGADPAPPPEALEVRLEGYEFPDDLRVAGSGRITFTSVDAEPHKIEISAGGQTGVFGAGDEVTLTAPDNAGTYDMVCVLHPSMTATLQVADAQ